MIFWCSSRVMARLSLNSTFGQSLRFSFKEGNLLDEAEVAVCEEAACRRHSEVVN